MTNPIPQPVWQIIDQNGEPIVGASVYTYIPGTLTSKASYADYQQITQNSNPVTTDSSGRTPAMWGFGGYRVIVKDASGNLIYDQITRTGLPEAAVSDAMLPVVGAATLSQARTLMGIDTAIQSGITSIVSTLIAQEAGARAAADAAEANARAGEDTYLQSQITNNANTLVSSVAAINAAIATLSGEIATAPSGNLMTIQTGSSTTDAWGNITVNYTPFPHALWQFSITPSSIYDSFYFYPYQYNLGLGIFTGPITQPNGQAVGSAAFNDPSTGLTSTVFNAGFTWTAIGY